MPRLLFALAVVVPLAVAALISACGVTCHCPSESTGPGWCPNGTEPGECACPLSTVCPGFCLDGGNPEPCDGG